MRTRTLKFFNVDGTYWNTSCVRKVIITDNECRVYFKHKKTPTVIKDFRETHFENKIKGVKYYGIQTQN